MDDEPRRIDRRTLIKGAAATGVVAWTAPIIIESIASPAAAASTGCTQVCSLNPPSSGCTWYAFRIEPPSTTCVPIGGGGSVCANITSALAALATAGITVNPTCPSGTVVSSATVSNVTVTLPGGCNVATAHVFAGGCCSLDSGPSGSCTQTYVGCGHDISHVDIIVCCNCH